MNEQIKEIGKTSGSTLNLRLETVQTLPVGSFEYLKKIPRNDLEADSMPFEVLSSLVQADLVNVENGKVSVKHDRLVIDL